MNENYKILGKKLFGLALEMSKKGVFPKKDFLDLVRPLHRSVAKSGPRKGWTLRRKVDEVYNVYNSIRSIQVGKPRQFDDPYKLPLERRVAMRRYSEPLEFVNKYTIFKESTSDDHFNNVTIVNSFVEANVSCDAQIGRWYNTGGYSHHTTCTQFNYKLPSNWWHKVLRKGMAIIDGMFTVALELVHEEEGIEVYYAKWGKQGAGYTIHTITGFIAKHLESGITIHSRANVRNAISALKRKVTLQYLPKEELERRSVARKQRAEDLRIKRFQQVSRLVSRLDAEDLGHVIVTFDDSLRAGNCRDGTEEFIYKFFGRMRESATIKEIFDHLRSKISEKDLLDFSNIQLGRQLVASLIAAIRRNRKAA